MCLFLGNKKSTGAAMIHMTFTPVLYVKILIWITVL